MKGIYWQTLTFKKSVIYLIKVNYTSYNYMPGNCTWTCLIAIANDTLGGFLMVDICMCIFVTILTVYFIPLVFDAFSKTHFNSVKFSFGLHCFILAIKTAVRWINFYRAGQVLANKCQNIKTILEDLLIDYQTSISKDEKTKLKMLIKRFDDPSPIRPNSSFDLNLSTAISAAGLIATYLVILVQFKQSNIDQTLQNWNEETKNTSTFLF